MSALAQYPRTRVAGLTLYVGSTFCAEFFFKKDSARAPRRRRGRAEDFLKRGGLDWFITSVAQQSTNVGVYPRRPYKTHMKISRCQLTRGPDTSAKGHGRVGKPTFPERPSLDNKLQPLVVVRDSEARVEMISCVLKNAHECV